MLLAGATGAVFAYGLQWYCNSWDYPIDVGGRPIHPAPAFIPITFETTVLFAAAAAFVGFLISSRLPEPWNPLFEIPEFERASVDRFWLAIDGRDACFAGDRTPVELAETAPLRIVRPEPRS